MDFPKLRHSTQNELNHKSNGLYYFFMRRSLIPVLALLAMACADRRDEPPPTSNVVEWNVMPGESRTQPDGSTLMDVELYAKVESGWKVYSLTQQGGGPVPLTVKANPPYQVEVPIKGPAVERAMDSNFGIETETYTGAPAFLVTVRMPASDSAVIPLELKVRSQACSDRLCLPARTVTLPVNTVPIGS
jgi:hypothetical protein